MLGDSGVGKTALVNRISEGVCSDSHVPTVGSQFIALPIRETKGAFLVVDVTNLATFTSLSTWIKFLNEQSPEFKSRSI
jgi:GTPase SAR1 family protein